MDTSKDKIDHLLALKVMRLTRPSLLSPLIVTTDQKDLPGTLLNDFLKNDVTSVPGSETIAASGFLLLPQCFGSIYLGETFSCYICIHNHSNQTVKDVTFKATLQTGTSNILLSSDPPNSTDLVPGATVDEVIHHDVKEFGPHILTCEVSYCSTTLSSDLLSFRKFFKFEVLKPLDVKTKIYNIESNEVCLEAQVQNITSGSLVLENVSLETSPIFHAEKMSINEGNNGLSLNIMAPNESKQYLYCTKPRPDVKCDIKELNNTTYIGKLDIVWRSNFGERGRLQTSQLNRLAQKFGDLYLSIEKIPSIIYIGEEVEIGFKITNTSDHTMEINLCLVQYPKFAWIGASGISLGVLGSNASKSFSLNIVPLCLGLQSISGIRMNEVYSKSTFEFDDITQVFVIKKPLTNEQYQKILTKASN